ncbi:MAG: MgtC/SapB family protein [Burkholderiales bacterium]|nr:MgtC/SapB family protein [Burkholderiales bacterium]
MRVHDLPQSLVPILHVAAALAAGGMIGIERTFRGRAAGFRTYALVCMGSAMAMVVAVFPNPWLAAAANAPVDVTRIVQGILTGIGFLGAGIIVKHGFSIRGLTTAASVWTTAVIGVLIGGRYYWEAAASVLLVLGTLSLFRRIEDGMHKENYARVKLSVSRAPGLPKSEIDSLILQSGLQIEQVSYGLEKNRSALDYEYAVSGFDPASLGMLAEHLGTKAEITAFQIYPSHE